MRLIQVHFNNHSSKLLFAIFIVLITFTSSSIEAQTDEKFVTPRFLLEFGAEWGGDELITVQFTNGNDQTMNAGQGIHLTAGTELAFLKIKNLLVRASFGLKWAPTAADDANIAFTRLPLTLSPFFVTESDFRIGVGMTAHFVPRFNGDGFVENIEFPTSVGPRFEIGYKFIAATYTLMSYDLNLEAINGNSFGIILSSNFTNK